MVNLRHQEVFNGAFANKTGNASGYAARAAKVPDEGPHFG
jgi:hypothetical protein